jgi:hypothetical protein
LRSILVCEQAAASKPQRGENIMTTISIPTLSTQRLVLDGLETLTRDGAAQIVRRAAAVAGLAGNDPYYPKTEVWGRNNPSQRLAGS